MNVRAKISGVFLRTSISNDVNVVYSSVRSGLRSLQRVPYEVAMGGGHSSHDVFCYPIESLQGYGYKQKIIDLLISSIGQKLKLMNSHKRAERICVHIVLPDGNKNDPEDMDESVMSSLMDFLGETLRIKLSTSSVSDGTLRALDKCITLLEEDECDHVFFGGVDSLINPGMIHEYAKSNRLLTDKYSDGTGLGEGLAFAHLSKPDLQEKKSPRAYISSISYSEEPENGHAESNHLTGLANSVRALLSEDDLTARDIHTIIHNYGGDISSVYERHQFINDIWPNELPEDLRVAIQLGEIEHANNPNEFTPEEICPTQTLGEIGSASVPVQLALATGFFKSENLYVRYGIPAVNKILLCESNNTNWRGAMCVVNPKHEHRDVLWAT